MAGLEPLVVFWTEWGIHFVVLVSFTVQVTLLLLADIRRRKDWALLKVVIWSAYMLADTTAIYALGHMSVLCNWSPEHQLMALWAPLLLVHLGGQDNITAYAIEDNRLWLRHLQTFVVQVAAAAHVLYVSSILSSHPMSSSNNKVSWAAILMLVVGVLKYGERIWTLKCANTCASSSLSATSYDNKQVSSVSRPLGESVESRNELVLAYSHLDVAKQMFQGPTSYVEIPNSEDVRVVLRPSHHEGRKLFVMELQLSMMYDLLYTKAAVVHTWYGLCSRVLISLPFTVTALMLFRSSSMSGRGGNRDAVVADAGLNYTYKRADVAVTNVLLVGAVVLETMSVLRAIFSKWTAVLLLLYGWDIIAKVLLYVEMFITALLAVLLQTGGFYWSGRMRQHNLFMLTFRTGNSTGSKIAKRVGLEDWWDSKFYSWSTKVPELVFKKVQKLASTPGADMTRSRALDAIRRSIVENNTIRRINGIEEWIWKGGQTMKLEESILVWHIATHVYMEWCWRPSSPSFYDVLRESFSHLGEISKREKKMEWYGVEGGSGMRAVAEATDALANYMFFLLAARPYMLPYPVSRQAYVQLCHDAATNFPRHDTERSLLRAILKQKEDLMKETALQPDNDEGIGRRQGNEETGDAQPQPSMNTTLDRGCQLAAKLIHITAKETKQDIIMPILQTKGTKAKGIIAEQAESSGNGKHITEQAESIVYFDVVLKMVLQVWVEMLCYTAYFCNENYHAKHLTDGGEIMTIVTLLMIYKKNGLIRQDTSTSHDTAGPSSQGGTATATATDTDTDSVV